MSNSGLVPNSFQHPNVLIDELQYFLTPEENTVLTKAVREILGWQDTITARSARISLSIFVNGKFINGERVCYGCGLGVSSVRKCLDTLSDIGVLIKTGEPNNDGQMYTLQSDKTNINWEWLKNRKDEAESANKKRTTKARSLIGNAGGTVGQHTSNEAGGTVGQHTSNEGGVLSDNTPGVLSDNTPGVLSDNNKETQQKPIETQTTTTCAGDEIFPAVENDKEQLLAEFENLFTAHFDPLSGNPKDPLTADVKTVLKEFGAATVVQAIRTALVDRAGGGKQKTWGYVKAILRGERENVSQNQPDYVAAGNCGRKREITGPARNRDRPPVRRFAADLPGGSGISLGD